jgi:SanA protein
MMMQRFKQLNPLRLIWRKRRLIWRSATLAVLLVLFFAVLVRAYSAGRASSQIYTLDTVADYPVAIIFGAWVKPDGLPSDMLADRVNMGAQLYQSGKVKALLLTGDNHITTYNEPEAMRQYALELGVPDAALVLDYAGFRTYDSCYRAHAIFEVEQAILVTQAFHMDRALLTCNGLGINAVGIAADTVRLEGYNTKDLLISELREFPSTTFALIDLIRNKQPTFLGEPLPIFAD